MRSSMVVTPGAAQAAATAASCSGHELTVPISLTVLSEASMSTPSASSLASRTIAFLME